MDELYMEAALKEARKAMELGEVPIGSVLVKDGKIVAKGHNETEKRQDPTAHAEINVIKKGAKKLGKWRLLDTTLYVTIEPCMMCAGAIISARVRRLVFGALEPKTGAVHKMKPGIIIEGGVLADEALKLMQTFFKRLRRGTEVWP
ncbi:MAG: tRNA adenosine(34) deaminase TadA [bacterium]